jgi:hypothetical protein
MKEPRRKEETLLHHNCAVCDEFDQKIILIRTRHRAAIWSMARQSSWDNPELARIARSENEQVNEVLTQMLNHRINGKG